MRRATSGWSCRWVPGTHDRVLLRSCGEGERELSVLDLARFAGRNALNDLYLRGRHRGECPDSPCLALGCHPEVTAAPPTRITPNEALT
ncbi:MAG TPA: hypothetical protein VNT60_08300 [Deinococcales bacterium]|nr:hypothetical protein [Deinococcales bacterium]